LSGVPLALGDVVRVRRAASARLDSSRPTGLGQYSRAVSGRSGDALLLLPIRLHGMAIGRAVDLIVDPDGRILGVDVLCRDEQHRFLPLAAAELLEDEIRVESALTLLEDRELAFYRARGRTLTGLRGSTVLHGDKPAGPLRDVVVGDGGAIKALVVGENGASRRIPFGTDVRFGDGRRRAPAA
jgi:hypothetical protein